MLIMYETENIKKMYNLPDKQFCCGCKACVGVCRQNALFMEEDGEGFLYPRFDGEKCVKCNKCGGVCPALENQFMPKRSCTRKSIAARCDEYAPGSASGGAFALMANKVLSMNGYAAGAVFNEEWKAEHSVANAVEDINKMRGSKYLQSDTSNSYVETKSLLDNGKYVLFSGTPCQIAGLYGFLSKDYDNLLTVDLICHGICSPMVWKKYLHEVTEGKKVKSVIFRNKAANAGNGIYHLDNDEYLTIEYDDNKKISTPYLTSDFIIAFLNNLILRPCCSNCRFAGRIRPGDITLGDLWTKEAAEDRKKGISQILANSKKGRDFLSSIENSWSVKYTVNLNKTKQSAPNINGHKPVHHASRKRFFDLIKNKSVKDVLDCLLHNKFDAAVLCMHGDNYGNQLTSYAMYQIVTDTGKTVLMIDRPLSSKSKPLKSPYSLFREIPVPDYSLSKIYPNKASMFELNDRIGIFLLPSDQVLRPSFVLDFDKYTLLDWVYDYKPKIAYSSSFGDDYFDGSDSLRAEIGFYLSRFNAISVREASGIQYAKQYFGINAEQVLDPVFLCDFGIYKNMALHNSNTLPQNFLGGYILDPSQEKAVIIKDIQKLLNLKNNCIIIDGNKSTEEGKSLWDMDFLKRPHAEEFLACVCYSDYFITDSFHGICFSIIFQKQFVVVYSNSQGRGAARINDFLGKLNLKNRMAQTYNEIINNKIFEDIINYNEVYAVLNSEILRSKTWLMNALNKAASYSGNKSAFDILNEKYQNIENNFNDLVLNKYVLIKSINGIIVKIFQHIRLNGFIYTAKLCLKKLFISGKENAKTDKHINSIL